MTRNLRRTLLAGLILGALTVIGGYFGYQAYKSARQVRLVRQAREFLEKPDLTKASLCLRRALRYNPKDVDACRLMAQVTESLRSRSALLWRSRVVDLNPDSFEDRLALAQTAALMGDSATATNALDAIQPQHKNSAAYHNVAGTVAVIGNQLDEAEAHFLEAARLEPQNPVVQLNLSVIRLHGTNTDVATRARDVLQGIASTQTNAALRCQALRELAVDAMRSRHMDSALALSSQLLTETNSTFRDRLLRLEVLRATTNEAYQAALADFQNEAARESASTFELAVWQLARTPPSETLAWLRRLPESAQTNQPVALLVAECYGMMKDWPGLQTFLEPQNWAELEFVRHALKARALRGQNLSDASTAEWSLAIKNTGGQKGRLIMLLRQGFQWNWASESEELLWTIVNQFPSEKWALATLNRILYQEKRTLPLLKLYSQEAKRSPENLAVLNNLAMTALLLGADEFKPHELAREVYQKNPTNAAFASTYAFSLHLQQKNDEALKVIEQLKPDELEEPGLAGYYGVILRATGDTAKAKRYLDLATKAKVLLHEEEKLFERARSGA